MVMAGHINRVKIVYAHGTKQNKGSNGAAKGSHVLVKSSNRLQFIRHLT